MHATGTPTEDNDRAVLGDNDSMLPPQSHGVGVNHRRISVICVTNIPPQGWRTLATFWAVILGGPAAASLLGALAGVEAELRIENWEISARLRLPAPPGDRRKCSRGESAA